MTSLSELNPSLDLVAPPPTGYPLQVHALLVLLGVEIPGYEIDPRFCVRHLSPEEQVGLYQLYAYVRCEVKITQLQLRGFRDQGVRISGAGVDPAGSPKSYCLVLVLKISIETLKG